jgi:hypothetical protein
MNNFSPRGIINSLFQKTDGNDGKKLRKTKGTSSDKFDNHFISSRKLSEDAIESVGVKPHIPSFDIGMSSDLCEYKFQEFFQHQECKKVLFLYMEKLMNEGKVK